jgi:Uncharacterized conserved domain (SAYSvFN)
MHWTVLVVWLALAWLTSLDRVFIILSVLVGIYFNLGSRRPGSYSAYNIFNKGFKHLLGDLRGDQIDAELRNKMIGRDPTADTNSGADDDNNDARQGGLANSKNANKLCSCGSKKKTKKCCGAVSAEEKDERQRLRQVELELQAKREKFQFL